MLSRFVALSVANPKSITIPDGSKGLIALPSTGIHGKFDPRWLCFATGGALAGSVIFGAAGVMLGAVDEDLPTMVGAGLWAGLAAGAGAGLLQGLGCSCCFPSCCWICSPDCWDCMDGEDNSTGADAESPFDRPQPEPEPEQPARPFDRRK